MARTFSKGLSRVVKLAPADCQVKPRRLWTQHPILLSSFAGKVATDLAGGRLFISDSNNHRLLIMDFGGKFIDQVRDPLLAASVRLPHTA